MTNLEAAISRLLPAALVHPDIAPVALGHVLGMLAQREADPAEAIRTAMRTAAAMLPKAEASAPITFPRKDYSAAAWKP